GAFSPLILECVCVFVCVCVCVCVCVLPRSHLTGRGVCVCVCVCVCVWKGKKGCQYHHYYIRMSHLRQDLWIQDRTIQPPENSPLRVRSGRHHRPRWTTTS